MKIRIKTLIALLVTTLCLFIIIHCTSASVIRDNFSKIEEDEITQTIVRLHIAATSRYTDLDAKLVNWAQQDATYEFIKSQNNSNPESYISALTMQNLGINYAIFLDENGKYVTGLGLNLTSLQFMAVPDNMLTLVSSEEQIWDLKKLESYTCGYIQVDGQPMLLASRPILTTNGNGPARGVLIFARYFDKMELTTLSYVLRVQLTMQTVAAWKADNFNQNGTLAASYVIPLNDQSIAGYDIIEDIKGQPLFVLGAVSPRTVYSQGIKAMDFIDQTLILSGIIFTIIISIVLEYSVLNRLGKLTKSVKKLGSVDGQSQMFAVTGNDEVTWLTRSINGLLKEIQLQSIKLQKSERLSAIGELARQVGHDLRNPLTSINNAVYYLKHKGNACNENDRKTMLTIIEKDIQRADKTITSLVDYSTELFVDLQKCTTKRLLRAALAKLTIPTYVNIIDKTSDAHRLEADKEKLEKVFREIIKNAVEAISKEGTLTVESKQVDSNIQITFADNGVGIPEKIVPKIFAPLMTTKAQGIGFSLAIIKRIIEAHGGTISFESQVGKGTTFTVILHIHPVIDLEKQNVALLKQDPLLHYERED
jgi:signal transduction histidine kinase